MTAISKIIGTIALGAVAGSAPRQAWNLLTAGAIERVTLQGDPSGLPGTVARYLEKVATVLWRPNPPIALSREYDRRLGRWVDVAAHLLIEVDTLYLYRGRLLLGGFFSKKDPASQFHHSGYAMSFARGTVDVDALVAAAMADSSTRSGAWRFCVHEMTGGGFFSKSLPGEGQPPSPVASMTDAPVRYIGGRKEDFGPPRQKPAASWMWWSEQAQQLREDARGWLQREQWCTDRGITSRRGWMLHGPPGNGKTLLVYAIAEELDLPIYAVDLSAMTSKDFVSAWKQASGNVPAIVLVEDFDSTIVGRNNIRSREHGVAFETILNCLAGVQRKGGILFVMTTNDPAAVDPALCSIKTSDTDTESRPGRIDLCVEIGNPTADGRRAISERVFAGEPSAEAWTKEVVENTDGMSIAQVQETCYRMLA